jgi:hypothetical protein
MDKVFLIFLSLSLFVIEQLFAKVRILTFHCNRPSFIELQQRTLQKFMLDDYELIVFNDGATPEMEREIREACNRCGIQCIRFQPEWHYTDPLNQKILEWLKDPHLESPCFGDIVPSEVTPEVIVKHGSARHCHLLQYAMDHYGYDHDDVVAVMDGDAFFIRKISLREKLKGLDILGMTRSVRGISYLWVPFIACIPTNLPNLKDLQFNKAVIDGYLHDTGSQLYHYLKDNPTVRSRRFRSVLSSDYVDRSREKMKRDGFSNQESWLIEHLSEVQDVEFSIDKSVLHFRAGRNETKANAVKEKYVRQFIDFIVTRAG